MPESVVRALESNTWKIILLFMQTITLPWLVWITISLLSIGTDVEVTKGNRFTSGDALEMRREILESLPPSWFYKEFTDLSEQVFDNESRIVRLEGVHRVLEGG